MKTAFLQTPIGILEINGDSGGVASVTFKDSQEKDLSEKIPNELKDVVKQIQEYFEGKRTIFTLSLAPVGTDFQHKVWKELQKIPYGKTVSYQQIANQLGNPKLIRPAASANGKNPLSIIIPCHRVIGNNGSLTGYSGGIHRKKWLLEHENPSPQQTLF